MKRLWSIPEGSVKFVFNNREGYVLPLVLVVMTLVFGTGMILISSVAFSVGESQDALNYQMAILSGKNAIEICREKLSEDSDYSGTNGKVYKEDGSVYSIKVQKISERERYISIRSEYGEYGRAYEGRAEMDPLSGEIQNWTLKLKGW